MKSVRIFLIAYLLISCNEITCRERIQRLVNRECNIVVGEIRSPGRSISLKGYKPNSGELSYYSDHGETWYVYFDNKIALGDTVVKNKGELIFSIHKKDTVLVFPFECEGGYE
jgi:hypothetical protein